MRAVVWVVGAAMLAACQPAVRQTEIENQADALADSLEAAADNMDALADQTSNDAGRTSASEPGSNWSYRQQEDKMRGASMRLATVSASEPIRLPFPYGESTPELHVRQDPQYGFDVYITANGQFLCRTYNNDTLSVKFDSGRIRQWACADADGGSSDTVFIMRDRAFLAELKKAHTVIVEAPMYEAGRQQMTFDVAGLKWK